MRTEITGKNITITPAMKEYFEKKLQKIEKFVIINDDTPARILVRTYKTGHKVEVTVFPKVGFPILRAEVTDYDAYAAMDLAVDKLVGQLRKQKTRLEKRHRNSITELLIAEGVQANEAEGSELVRTKIVDINAIPLEEAILQMELSGHNFYAYIDEETDKPAIVYRKKTGGYGVLELRY